jgi:hypothetical protein
MVDEEQNKNGHVGHPTCPKCGGIRGGLFCNACGATLVPYIDPACPWCPKCLRSRPMGDKFCAVCGDTLAETVPFSYPSERTQTQ